MKILTSVLKDREIQNYIQENEDASFEYLKNAFNVENIYNYVIENINHFVVENDIGSSYSEIKNFSKSYVLTILNEAIDAEVVKDVAGKIVGELMDKGIVKHDSADVAITKVTEFLSDKTNNFALTSHGSSLQYARTTIMTNLAKMLNDENLLNDGKTAKSVLRQWITNRQWEVDGVVKKITRLQDYDIVTKFQNSFNSINAARQAAEDAAKAAANATVDTANEIPKLNLLGKFTKILGDNWDAAVHAVSSTPRGKLLIGATAGVVTILGGAAAWYKSSTSEQNEAASIGTSVVDNLEKGNDVAAVKVVDNAVGDLDTSKLVETSYFKSFISFCDSSFEKLSSTSSDLWDRAKELASEHPYASVAILIFSAIGIASAYSKKGSSGVGLSTKGSNNRLVTKTPVKKLTRSKVSSKIGKYK